MFQSIAKGSWQSQGPQEKSPIDDVEDKEGGGEDQAAALVPRKRR